MLVWRYNDDVMMSYYLKRVNILLGRKRVGNKTVNYWASAVARDEMPEPVVINLDSDYDDSLTDTANENEDEICRF